MTTLVAASERPSVSPNGPRSTTGSNKLRGLIDSMAKPLPPEIKEDLDTHFAGILSVIRSYRNESGHPTGKIMDREQTFVLLQLFIPYCKKQYQLMQFFR